MSKKCKAYSASKLGLAEPDNRKAFYAGWDAAVEAALGQGEPVARVAEFQSDVLCTIECLPHTGPMLQVGTLLYTKPQTQPKQEPVNLEDIEQYRLQMEGISTAAHGYWKEGDGIHPDYDTVALRDVAKLYAKYDELYKQVHAPQPQRDDTDCRHCNGSGRMVRDPDIGTDQECFVCDGSGMVQDTVPQPQRGWARLTDEEIREIESRMLDMGTVFDLMRLIEAKLRAKNGGGV